MDKSDGFSVLFLIVFVVRFALAAETPGITDLSQVDSTSPGGYFCYPNLIRLCSMAM